MKTGITILYVCSRLLQLNWSQCEPQVQLNWLYVHICYQLNWSQRQVANAEANPTSFRPWKPNCQMTPNEEDIIGGRFASSSSSMRTSTKRISMKRTSMGAGSHCQPRTENLVHGLFWITPNRFPSFFFLIFASVQSSTVQYMYTLNHTDITLLAVV